MDDHLKVQDNIFWKVVYRKLPDSYCFVHNHS